MTYLKESSKIYLNENQLLFMKFHVYGYSSKDIKETSFSFTREKNQIEYIFGTNNWGRIIKNAFINNILNPYDFTEQDVKNIASDYANKIYNHIKIEFDLQGIYEKKLNDIILEFVEACNLKLLESKSFNTTDISEKEKQILELIYKRLNSDEDFSQEFEIIRYGSLSQILPTNCWYQLVNKAFQYDVLLKKDYSTIDLKQEAILHKNDILKIVFTDEISELEVKYKIYYMLIHLYNLYKYSYLLPNTLLEN